MIRYAGEKIKVVLLDDHPMIRLSLEMAASHHPDMQVSGSFSHSQELLTWLQKNTADVLVLDYILGGDELDGLSLIKQILSRHPKLKILLSSSMESLAVIRAAFMSGIKGYISKREEAQAYFEAIRVINSGLRFIPDNIESELSKIPVRKRDGAVLDGPLYHANGEKLSRLDTLLSPREAEVIRCFLDGMQVIEIAEKLKRSRKTISGHKQSGMKKLGLSTDLELFKYRDHLF
ncbi:response regulator transcription factor [Pantoea sp. S61]|uniref:response regulator transcription factor n=1 Tax=Pantoea sp. S61 TaxID=2767442 RepID=UPI0019097643|nr:response regulator transcription factor [Pantoea sp. S61]MBK0126285.1 response regulator transcription factor [Pantoea sp. S61]